MATTQCFPFNDPSASTLLEGQSVVVRARFVDRTDTPIPAPSIRLLVQPPTGQAFESSLTDTGGGFVESEVPLLLPGLWRFRFEGVAPFYLAAHGSLVVLARHVPEVA